MCGICGKVNFGPREPVEMATLRAMNEVIRHRGPDDDGFFLDGPVGLASRRLSIIDVAGGRQPIHNEDATVWIVFNGEIYNFPQLRRELVGRGHHFYTNTDTEVIVHLYEERGADCLLPLNGMFAFALWDSRTRTLLLARDRVGIKPLFYCQTGRALLFGSEIKSILQDSGVTRSVDLAALHNYLSLNYLAAPQTLFQGIRQLPPGCLLLVEDGKVSVRRYWDLKFDLAPLAREEDYVERGRELLRLAVERQMISDVPLGAFLSGGLDSSSIVAFMAGLSEQPVQTFSLGFREASYDELKYARLVARQFATEHHELVVDAPKVLELLPKLIWHAEEPTADSSQINVYLVSAMTRQKVKVVLSGDGGDEVFAGYDTYLADQLRRHYRRLPAWLRRKVIAPLARALPVSLDKVSFDYKAKRFVAGAELPPPEAHGFWRIIFTEEEKQALYRPELLKELNGADTLREFRAWASQAGTDDLLNRVLYMDTMFYLPGDMLTKVDRMSMAVSLEARVPMLDHELVEFLASVPPQVKFKRWRKKHLLKEMMSGLLPPAIINRGKAGFNLPVGAWFCHQLRDLAADLLSPSSIAELGFFRAEAVNRLLAEHWAGKQDHSHKLWGLVILTLWHRNFIAGEAKAPLTL